MKILLVGLGAWGTKHFRVLQSLPVELFCCDLKAERLKEVARASVNYRDFLPEVDAAVIVTPAPSHATLAREFLAAGKDVFVEKPLALTVDECRGLAELAEDRGRVLQVGHIFRFDTATAWLRDALRDGTFGSVRMLRGRFCGFKRPRSDGGGLFSDGIHFIDLFNYLLGATPKSVQAMQRDFLGRGMDDESIVSLEYQTANGPVWATVETDYFTPGKHREVTVIGERLSAVCDYAATGPKIRTFENRHAPSGSVAGPTASVETAAGEPLRAELEAFLKSVVTREKPLADAWAGRDVVAVLNAAASSAKSGGIVPLK